ncbi:hypoxanthine phosphoribosyltransferase [Sporosalibacterium faouarense]|uniref:hypoxanthine phosphoribosyltransferase n=1 Tax=Sporosalibacterium faouarense TaxID=516123 RepID=UPI00141C4A7D|nr:hypoxanthine phosphoribosyltransferase [Sporosalibacterium faouarense]MTI46498.1 hypoxanthine phosphoribosyltransferase [Bacillota bacterium]
MKDYIKKILITSEEIESKVKELANGITNDYKDKDLVVIGVLKGAAVFMSDLIKYIDVPLTMDFIAVSSYGRSTESSGVVKMIKDLEESIEGKDVLIVEDIIDTGLTLSYLIENLKSRGPRSVRICTLLDKPERRKVDVKVDYMGFKIPDEFVVGYGIDFAENYRNSPFISVVKEECYK